MISLTGLMGKRNAHRDGDLLVVPHGAELPLFCVRCGEPTTVSVRKVCSWHPPWLYLVLLFGVLPYAIVLAFARRKCSLVVPLCESHLLSYRRRRWVGIWIMLAGIPLAVVAGVVSPENAGWGWLVGIVTLFVGFAVFSTTNYLTPTFIDEIHATFRGASLNFLQRL